VCGVLCSNLTVVLSLDMITCRFLRVFFTHISNICYLEMETWAPFCLGVRTIILCRDGKG